MVLEMTWAQRDKKAHGDNPAHYVKKWELWKGENFVKDRIWYQMPIVNFTKLPTGLVWKLSWLC